MTKPRAPYTARFNRANGRGFTFRMERELMTARENVYDLVRDRCGLPAADVSDLRVLFVAGEMTQHVALMFNYAETLYQAQRSLLEAGKMLL